MNVTALLQCYVRHLSWIDNLSVHVAWWIIYRDSSYAILGTAFLFLTWLSVCMHDLAVEKVSTSVVVSLNEPFRGNFKEVKNPEAKRLIEAVEKEVGAYVLLCFLSYILTCRSAYIHACIHPYIHPSIHPSIHTYIHTYVILHFERSNVLSHVTH